MKTVPELVPVAARHIAGRDGTRGALRVDLEQVEQLTFEALPRGGPEARLTIDEPAERGGLGRGPAPLQYFLAGAGSCLLTQYAKLAMAWDLPLQSLSGTVRAHIHHRRDGAFTDMVFEVSLAGPLTREQAAALAEEAERCCYVYNTLKGALDLATSVSLNGEPVASFSTPKGRQG